mmetsp:Transcript_12611/g.36702  ORF Transcript_12611/g.36702 Transcript_12611/m.36702 type:complete len:314 (-) Transcript_12611:83-1024(-)
MGVVPSVALPPFSRSSLAFSLVPQFDVDHRPCMSSSAPAVRQRASGPCTWQPVQVARIVHRRNGGQGMSWRNAWASSNSLARRAGIPFRRHRLRPRSSRTERPRKQQSDSLVLHHCRQIAFADVVAAAGRLGFVSTWYEMAPTCRHQKRRNRKSRRLSRGVHRCSKIVFSRQIIQDRNVDHVFALLDEIREVPLLRIALRVHDGAIVSKMIQVARRDQPIAAIVVRSAHQKHCSWQGGRQRSRHRLGRKHLIHGFRNGQPRQLHQLLQREPWCQHEFLVQRGRVLGIQVYRGRGTRGRNGRMVISPILAIRGR